MNLFKIFWKKSGKTYKFRAVITLVDQSLSIVRNVSIVSDNLHQAEFEVREAIHRDFKYSDIRNIELFHQ